MIDLQASNAYESSSWLKFSRAINTKATSVVYNNSMKVFMRYLAFENPDQLLVGSNEQIEDGIMGFIDAQKKDGLSSSIIQTRLAAIKLFYDMNRRALAWKLVRRTVGKTRKHKDRPYTKQEIQKLLTLADLRTRVAILLLSSTGIRIGAVPDMKVKHLTPVDKYGIFKIIVYADDDEEYITYCTPECRKAIEEYLGYRERCGEKIKGDSPMLRSAFDKSDPLEVAKVKPVSEITISILVRRLMIDAGLRQKMVLLEGQNAARIRHEIKTLHGFRKFYDTEMTKAGVNLLWTEILEGHDIKLKESYFKPTENDLLEGNDKMLGYVMAIDALTINEENRLKVKVKKLEADKADLIDLLRTKVAALERANETRQIIGEDQEKFITSSLGQQIGPS